MKAAARAQQKQTYLMLDKYTRGKVEKQIVDFDKELKTKRKKQLRKGKQLIDGSATRFNIFLDGRSRDLLWLYPLSSL